MSERNDGQARGKYTLEFKLEGYDWSWAARQYGVHDYGQKPAQARAFSLLDPVGVVPHQPTQVANKKPAI